MCQRLSEALAARTMRRKQLERRNKESFFVWLFIRAVRAVLEKFYVALSIDCSSFLSVQGKK